MLERALRVWVFMGLLCAALGCGKTVDAPTGTNTNWLWSCEDDGDCSNGNECICGVCTRFCSAASQCSALDEDASCTNVAECGGPANDRPAGPAGQAACLLGCSSDDDCGALANGECRNGVCLPRIEVGAAGSSAPPPPDASVPDGAMPGNPDGGPGIDPYALRRDDNEIVIGAAYLDCAVDEDCTLVATGCDSCCQWGAIDADLRATYDENFDRACADYRGGECDCDFQPTVATCIAGTCRATQACFSPSQHSQRAYDIGARGCACDQPDDAICIGRVGLVCAQSPRGPVWTAVEDGPCEPRVESCVPERVRDNPVDCLALYTTCRELPNGEFCGEGCSASLDCTTISCASYTPLEGPECTGFPEIIEGLCDDGMLRYRAESGGFTGVTRFWNVATGALVAAQAWSDAPSFCGNTAYGADYGDGAAIARCLSDEESRDAVCPE